MSFIFHTFFYDPIYNALVALVAVLPGGDVGLAVIVVTIAIRLILLPFSIATARTQRAMKILEPKIKALRELHKGNKEKEAIETLALYREAKVNPFASIASMLIQIPLLLALYWVFFKEPFPALNEALLYAITPSPEHVSLLFLGFIAVAGKSAVLAVLAGLSQYFQAHVALQGTMKPSAEKGMQQDFQRVMGLQLKYVFPFIIATVSYTTSGAIALYFVTTNLAGVLQEWYMRRRVLTEAQSA